MLESEKRMEYRKNPLIRYNVAIGIQNFGDLIENNYFYIDKTSFIREWWDSGDSVTLIARPRRFGKTLNMSMVEQFFSMEYAKRGDLFKGLSPAGRHSHGFKIWHCLLPQKMPGGFEVRMGMRRLLNRPKPFIIMRASATNRKACRGAFSVCLTNEFMQRKES